MFQKEYSSRKGSFIRTIGLTKRFTDSAIPGQCPERKTFTRVRTYKEKCISNKSLYIASHNQFIQSTGCAYDSYP